MMKINTFSIFSEEEDRLNSAVRSFRDRVYAPVCHFMAGYHIKPYHLSYIGFAMVIPFIYFFPVNPWFSFLAILLNMFFDSLDGPYSRYLRVDSIKGAMIDVSCDYLSFLIIFMTFLYYGLMNGFWAVFYIVNYFIMLGGIIFCRNEKISFFPVMRSKYYIYGTFMILLMGGYNLFDPIILFFGVYMLITNILLFNRIRCSLR
jgi:phosphatidylglycerophosphate synthase